jgi:hypothetical protein
MNRISVTWKSRENAGKHFTNDQRREHPYCHRCNVTVAFYRPHCLAVLPPLTLLAILALETSRNLLLEFIRMQCPTGLVPEAPANPIPDHRAILL